MQICKIKSLQDNIVCNLFLGLFSPFRHEIETYKNYDVTKFRDNLRFMEIIANRDGASGILTPLFFDGMTCNFTELPRPDDNDGLQKVYDYINQIN